MAMIDYNGLILQCQSLATLVNKVVLLESSDKTDELNLLPLKRLLLTHQKQYVRDWNVEEKLMSSFSVQNVSQFKTKKKYCFSSGLVK